jgi:adenine-specific DNA-methyltransferase
MICGAVHVNYLILDAGVNVRVEYLLALLNSKLLNFVFAKTSTNSNVNGYEVDNLPIIVAKKPIRDKIAELATKLLALKKHNPEADTTNLEREIDQLVCRIYGLTETDIAVVENGGV